jgi:hypothetical protein
VRRYNKRSKTWERVQSMGRGQVEDFGTTVVVGDGGFGNLFDTLAGRVL